MRSVVNGHFSAFQVISKNLEPPKPAMDATQLNNQLTFEQIERAAYNNWLVNSPAPMVQQQQGVVISGSVKDFVRLRGV